MGCDFKDFDGDGRPDIFVTDLVRDIFTLFVNQGKGFFLDRSFPSAVGPASAAHSGWSTKFLDVDNDGLEGHLRRRLARGRQRRRSTTRRRSTRRAASSTATRARAASRTSPGEWVRTSRSPVRGAGWRWPTSTTTARSRSPCSRLNGAAALFVKKGGAAHNWILLDLVGTRSNRDGIGARVRLVLPSGRTLHEHVTTAHGIYSASDKRVHFGLGTETAVAFIEITWPSGIVQRVEKPAINQVLRIVETAP